MRRSQENPDEDDGYLHETMSNREIHYMAKLISSSVSIGYWLVT